MSIIRVSCYRKAKLIPAPDTNVPQRVAEERSTALEAPSVAKDRVAYRERSPWEVSEVCSAHSWPSTRSWVPDHPES